MAKFGLDNSYVKKLTSELEVESVRLDQVTDFFFLPQLDAIYEFCGDKLKAMVAKKLNDGVYGPKPPIEMEIPKYSRVLAKNTSLYGPNYFRPGSSLLPEDRVVYHFIAQQAEQIIEKALNRKRVFSNKPLQTPGQGFASSAGQWKLLTGAIEKTVKSGKYKIALKCDISQYFFSINQHELVNQLEHQGLPSEIVKFAEKFLSSLTLDRSSRGIVQGLYASDLLGNGYLSAIDEFIENSGYVHFRYVDDMYIFFETADEFRSFFPKFVRKLRDYDLSLNESKTSIFAPIKLLREETELDKAIEAAKKEAAEKLTDYEEVEVYDEYGVTTAVVETAPDQGEVDLESTIAIFNRIDDFKGEERRRAENFCLNFFRRAADPIAVDYVAKRWLRNPDQAREYALYLNRFAKDVKHVSVIDKMIEDNAEAMVDYQWAWAAFLMRRMKSVSAKLLTRAANMQQDGARNEVIRSLLTYPVSKHGSPHRKKDVRDGYGSAPLLVQLAIIHCGHYFTSGERSALMKTAEAHGDIQALMCEALRKQQKVLTGAATA